MVEQVESTHVAGVGRDGNLYGVTSVDREGKRLYRRKPCKTCPWRRDAAIGRFPAEAFRKSAETAYDLARESFACHEQGVENPATCAGFLLRGADHNLSVRIAVRTGQLDLDAVSNADDVDLFGSYREMAVANGVDPDDPRLRPCR